MLQASYLIKRHKQPRQLIARDSLTVTERGDVMLALKETRKFQEADEFNEETLELIWSGALKLTPAERRRIDAVSARIDHEVERYATMAYEGQCPTCGAMLSDVDVDKAWCSACNTSLGLSWDEREEIQELRSQASKPADCGAAPRSEGAPASGVEGCEEGAASPESDK